MTGQDKIGAVSADVQWVADKLSEYGFTMEQLDHLYPAAEAVAMEWARRGDSLISIDLVTGEMRRRFRLKFSNTVRPFLARLLRERRAELRPLIEVSTTSRGRNKNLKVALDHLDVVGVVVRTADGVKTLSLEEAAVLGNRRREEAKGQGKRPRAGKKTENGPAGEAPSPAESVPPPDPAEQERERARAERARIAAGLKPYETMPLFGSSEGGPDDGAA